MDGGHLGSNEIARACSPTVGAVITMRLIASLVTESCTKAPSLRTAKTAPAADTSGPSDSSAALKSIVTVAPRFVIASGALT